MPFDLNAELEEDEARRQKLAPNIEQAVAEIADDAAHHSDSIRFSNDYKKAFVSHWTRRFMEEFR